MICSLLVCVIAGNLVVRADYLGAKSFLEQLAVEAPAPDPTENKATVLKSELEKFATASVAMTPEAAADEWLSLVDRFWELSPEDMSGMVNSEGEMELSARSLVIALPPPSSWDALVEKITSRAYGTGTEASLRTGALKLMAHTLVGNKDGFVKTAGACAAVLAQSENYNAEYMATELNDAVKSYTTIAGDALGIKEAIEKTIKERLKADDEDTLELPDLVSLLGAEEAERLLRKAIVLPKTMVSIELGEETKEMARKLIVEMIKEVKNPQWELAKSLFAIELYEALNKKYPATATSDDDTESDESDITAVDIDPSMLQGMDAATIRRFSKMVRNQGSSMSNRSRDEAAIYYLLGLVVAGRTDDARQQALSMSNAGVDLDSSYTALRDLEKAGYVDEVYAFIKTMLQEDPELPFWSHYISLSARFGETEEMLAYVKAQMENNTIDPIQRGAMDELLIDALLAADKPDEAVALMRKSLTEDNESKSEGLATAVKMAQLGVLLKRPEWMEEGIAVAKEKVEKTKSDQSILYAHGLSALAMELIEIGRGPEAERSLLDMLKKKLLLLQKPEFAYYENVLADDMELLLGLYAEAGKMDDVLTLLDESPWWGVGDLADKMDTIDYSPYRMKTRQLLSMPMAAASALHAAGRDAEAIPILESILYRNGGYDPAYELYVAIQGTNALVLFDRIYAMDQYEERPLIWKAHILRKEGRLAEAKEIAKAAIAIDPSDGEQGKGMRMRVYAEMAAIAEAEGDLPNATFFGEVIKAIRLSEDADDFYSAGLLSRGVAMYKEALEHFSNAYCIQSRMAIQLEQLGRLDEAEQHYQRAYELMPDSFGFVESHCFGCEGVFESGRAQSIAERVFASLAVKNPTKPQVHYLLGYLRDSQGREAEALASYRKAVELEPNYLNAWQKIGSLGERMQLSAADRDAVVFMQYRLDPLSRHGRPNSRSVYDLKSLWNAVSEASKVYPVLPETLYPLKASAAKMEEQTNTQANNPMFGHMSSYRSFRRHGSSDHALSAGEVIANHEVMNAVVRLLDYREHSY